MNPYGSYPSQYNFPPAQQQQPYNPYMQQNQFAGMVANQRLQEMERTYPQYGQQVPQQQQVTPQPVYARAVTSMVEAEAYPVNFDDTIFVFVEPGTGRIYTKQWDRNTGGAPVREYQMVQAQPKEQTPPEVVPETPQVVPAKVEPDPMIDLLLDQVTSLEKRIIELEATQNVRTNVTADDAV